MKEAPADLAMFAQINANHPRLVEWLKAQDARAVQGMGGREPVSIYRAQGDHARLEKMIDLLTNAGKYISQAQAAPTNRS